LATRAVWYFNHPQQLASTAASENSGASAHAPQLRIFVFALFFIFGVITSLNDVIIPKLKELFTLSYGEASAIPRHPATGNPALMSLASPTWPSPIRFCVPTSNRNPCKDGNRHR